MILETLGLALLVAMAAGFGAVTRYLLGAALNREFPVGTLATNLAACLALGALTGADDPLPIVVGVGFLGALSTWSTVANEAAEMARDNQGPMALAYLGLTVTSGVVAAWAGLQLGKVLW